MLRSSKWSTGISLSVSIDRPINWNINLEHHCIHKSASSFYFFLLLLLLLFFFFLFPFSFFLFWLMLLRLPLISLLFSPGSRCVNVMEDLIVDDSICDVANKPPDQQKCHIACPGDCVVSPWTPWTPCHNVWFTIHIISVRFIASDLFPHTHTHTFINIYIFFPFSFSTFLFFLLLL